MITGFLTFLFFFAIIGCVLDGRKLIRTKKVDAVFGNPERAKGGTHWIIVGSSVILLTWLYYSWDIAKSFYPQSANELCQVGKVNDSLLSLKYLFPIEEREFKSTSIIKSENKNIAKLKNEIQNSKDISEQHRSFLIGLIDKTKSTIPLLTNEALLDNQTKVRIFELTGKIDQLSSEFQKKEQGSLKYVDIFLFPAGTIVSSGPNCSEQGSGRWLPKPSDTLDKFILLSKPSVGFKNIPLLWFEMMDVSKIFGFILPDWIADIIPGKYPVHNEFGVVEPNFKSKVLSVVTGEFSLFKIPVTMGHIWDSFLRVLLGLVIGIILGVPLGLFMGLNRFAKGFFDPLIELYRPVPPLAWAPLIISVLGIDNVGKVFLLFMVSFSIMIISARAGASGTQLSKIHASHSLGASRWQILRYVIFPNSLPEILTGVRVAIGMCWGTLVAAEFLAGTTGIGFVENVAKKYFQYEII